MKILLRTERIIKATPEAVFALSLDPQRFPQVFTGFGPISRSNSTATRKSPLAVPVSK